MIVAAFALAASLSFALSLMVAGLLGPEAFGRYALASAVSALWALAAFDWLRLCVTRFASDPARPDHAAVRATLRRCLLGAGAATVVAAALAGGVTADALLPAALAAGGAAGTFEYAAALARAAGADGRYMRLAIGRGAASLAACGLAAALTRDPAVVVAASAGATAATVAVAGWRDLRPPAGGTAEARLVPVFLRYALPVTAAAALFAAVPLVNRALLAGRAGFVEAGVFGLVGELCAKLFQNAGAALDAALFQKAVHAERRGAADATASHNLALAVAVLAPAAAGLGAVWPAFEALFLPAAFAGSLSGPALLTAPAFAIFAVTLYGLAPVLQLRRRTGPVAWAAAAGLALDGLLLVAWPEPDAVAAAAIQAAGFALAALLLLAAIGRAGGRPPWASMGLSVAGAAGTAALLWPTRDVALSPALLLPLQVVGGAALYGAFALLVDLAGCRTELAAWRQRPVNPFAKSTPRTGEDEDRFTEQGGFGRES